MALRSRSQVELIINSTVQGLDSVNKLARSLDGLTEEEKQARNELTKLNAELKSIATQSGAIENFRRQKVATEQLSKSYLEARERSTQLGRALSQTANPTRQQTREFERARAETTRLNQQYQKSAVELQRLRGALSSSGVSIRNLANEQTRLSREAQRSQQSLTTLESKVRQLSTARKIPDITKPLRDGAQQTSTVIGGIPKLLGAIGVTVGLSQVVSAFTQAAKSGESFQRALNQITQSADQTAAQTERLQALTEKYGLEVTGLERAFVNFNAAVQGTNFEGEKGAEIFETFAGALGALGKSSADIEGALLAVNQIISKNTVSSEELRQQLSERLPGAMRLSAEALGVTTERLSELLQTGQITANDLLPKLAVRLREAYNLDVIDRVEGIAAAQNRLSNAVTNLFRSISESGVGAAFAAVLNGLTTIVNGLSSSFDGTEKSIDSFSRSLESGAGALAAYGTDADAATENLAKVGAAADKTKEKIDELAEAQRRLAAEDLIRRQQLVAKSIDIFAVAAGKASRELDNLRAKGDENTEAYARAEIQFEKANARLIELNKEYLALGRTIDETLSPAVDRQKESLERAAESTKALVEEMAKQAKEVERFLGVAERELSILEAQNTAKLEQARTALKIAEIREDENGIILASLRLAAAEADAAKALADQKQRIATTAAINVQALINEANADREVTKAEQEGIDKAKALALEKQALADAAKATADALIEQAAATAKAAAEENSSVKRMQELASSLRESRIESEKARDATRGLAEESAKTADSSGRLGGTVKIISDNLKALVVNAREAGESLSTATEQGTAEFQQINRETEAFLANLKLIDDFGRSPRSASALFREWKEDILRIRDLMKSASDAILVFSDNSASAAETQRALQIATQLTANHAHELGDETLSKLRQGIDDAKRKMLDFAQTIEDARRELQRLEADRLEALGKGDEAADLRDALELREKLAELEARIAEARRLGLFELVNLLEEQKRKLLEIARIEEQAEARERRQRERERERQQSGGSSGTGASGGGRTPANDQNIVNFPRGDGNIGANAPRVFNFNALNADNNSFREFVAAVGRELHRQDRLAR